ncbi:MAG: archaeal proteasome endopeptidase complex subunit alpha [Candidatus Altiarchaeota archaeon]|nr:archaeal proteasome endopeptidase complex subunit alpha [Candidatus Altiarchaeota archaeon]
MQMIAPEGMGYDRVVTVFSPDGRLFQVQYAMEAVKRGATVIGITAKDGIVLVADKKVLHPLVHFRSIEKISKVDHSVGAATIGLVADGKKLIDEARLEAQRHRLIYDEPIKVHQLVKDVSSYMQLFTQYGGLRPFGVTILIGGYDNKPKLFEVDPSGTPTEWKATAIGEGRTPAIKILESGYKESLLTDDALRLGIKALKEILKDKFQITRIAAAVVTEKGFKHLSQDEMEGIIHGSKN